MIFKRERPDIVHTLASMSARIAAKQAGAKVVYTRHSVFEPSKKISRGIGKVINGMIKQSLCGQYYCRCRGGKGQPY